jgi:poly-gamma-glutamate synthesis protein (capsule biosynthesis protein)
MSSRTLFLCGDVMTGRGIDQILPTPGDPELREPTVRDAREYVALAERRAGPISRPVPYATRSTSSLARVRTSGLRTWKRR